MEITLRATNKRIKKKMVRDFQWYDPYTRKVWKDRGGRMMFRYDPALKRSIPYVVEEEDWVTENNYEELIKWVTEKGFDIIDTAHRHFVTIDVPAIEFESVTRELYNNRIVFDLEESNV